MPILTRTVSCFLQSQRACMSDRVFVQGSDVEVMRRTPPSARVIKVTGQYCGTQRSRYACRCRSGLGLLQVIGIRGSPDSILALRRLYHRALVRSRLSWHTRAAVLVSDTVLPRHDLRKLMPNNGPSSLAAHARLIYATSIRFGYRLKV